MRIFMPQVSANDFEKAIEGGLIKQLRILLSALALAPWAYLALGYASSLRSRDDLKVDPVFMILLTGVAVVELVLAWRLPEQKLKSTDLEAVLRDGLQLKSKRLTEPSQIVSQLTMAHFLLRAAM